jgi:uncharacterized protein YcfL
MPHALTLSRSTLALIALAGLAALGACNSDPAMAPAGAPQDALAGDAYPAVRIEADLQGFVVVDYGRIIKDEPTDERPLGVQVPVRSTSDTVMRVQYRFLWFDAAGRTLGESGWRYETMSPRAQVLARANATRPDVRQWRMEIRSAR